MKKTLMIILLLCISFVVFPQVGKAYSEILEHYEDNGYVHVSTGQCSITNLSSLTHKWDFGEINNLFMEVDGELKSVELYAVFKGIPIDQEDIVILFHLNSWNDDIEKKWKLNEEESRIKNIYEEYRLQETPEDSTYYISECGFQEACWYSYEDSDEFVFTTILALEKAEGRQKE